MPERQNRRRAWRLPLADRIRIFFEPRRATAPPVDPLHSDIPALRNAELAAIYFGQRMAGDFYEFLRVGPSRVLFGLFDIAGRREDTRQVLIAAQTTLRVLAPRLFQTRQVNEADVMIELSQQINRTILQFEGGVPSCPAFIGCYNEDMGTACYANAGHTPALLRDATSITLLEANGLPLGLFSHTTREAHTVSLSPGAILLIVSLGIVEAKHEDEEFGLEGVEATLREASASTARDTCGAILHATQEFTKTEPTHNDLTALALLHTRTAESDEIAG